MPRAARALLVLLAAQATQAELPPVPVPTENPITEHKRILGKILFWDEQLSSDNTIACGTCHRPEAGGADPRRAVHPGQDPGTIDDVHGSPGIAHLDARGLARAHPMFGLEPQVTTRTSPSIYGALWAEALFWDGRASGRVLDPETGEIVIERGGALENQALMALSSSMEMSKPDRRWQELEAKLERVAPLGLAREWPPDIAARLSRNERYPELFAAAFGDPAITAVRIAFALASYERTLVPDQTPWDRYMAGDETALDATERYGWQAMQDFQCTECHTPPLFTNDDFLNIGLRLAEHDPGRMAVTGVADHAGDMKVPSLRNVGLRPRFMHTGQFDTLAAAVAFYRTGQPTPERDNLPNGGIYAFNMGTLTEADITAFLSRALTDPRVQAARFPFDRPRLRTERDVQDRSPPVAPSALRADVAARRVELSWRPGRDDTGVVDYVVLNDEAVIGYTSEPYFSVEIEPGADPEPAQLTDALGAAALTRRYYVIARDAARNASAATSIEIRLSAP